MVVSYNSSFASCDDSPNARKVGGYGTGIFIVGGGSDLPALSTDSKMDESLFDQNAGDSYGPASSEVFFSSPNVASGQLLFEDLSKKNESSFFQANNCFDFTGNFAGTPSSNIFPLTFQNLAVAENCVSSQDTPASQVAPNPGSVFPNYKPIMMETPAVAAPDMTRRQYLKKCFEKSRLCTLFLAEQPVNAQVIPSLTVQETFSTSGNFPDKNVVPTPRDSANMYSIHLIQGGSKQQISDNFKETSGTEMINSSSNVCSSAIHSQQIEPPQLTVQEVDFKQQVQNSSVEVPLLQPSPPVAAPRKVSFNSPPSNNQNPTSQNQNNENILYNLSFHTETTIRVPPKVIVDLFGENYSRIFEIRDMSRANVQIDASASPNIVVKVKGNLEQIQAACSLFDKNIQQNI